jgi:hypothetical protein
MAGPNAPKTFEQWVEAYEERGNEYVTSPGERVVFDSAHGFFTYLFNPASKEILIPKMCGDGKHWRRAIHKLATEAKKKFGVKGVYCCCDRNPMVWLRANGGKLRKVECTYDFVTGKSTALWFFSVTLEDSKERGIETVGNDSDIDSDVGVSAGNSGSQPR